MKIEIKSIAGSILFEGDFGSLKAAVEAAVSQRAYLAGAYLAYANLADANLAGANLAYAYLAGANLADANLADANLAYAYLAGANLADASLARANLADAYLTYAKIPEQLLASIYAHRTITPDGDLVGWKKLANGTICKLLIPADAKRVGGLIGRKCRAEFAKVLEGDGLSQFKDAKAVVYSPGIIVRPDKYDPDPRIECSNGIHFFITLEEAEAL